MEGSNPDLLLPRPLLQLPAEAGGGVPPKSLPLTHQLVRVAGLLPSAHLQPTNAGRSAPGAVPGAGLEGEQGEGPPRPQIASQCKGRSEVRTGVFERKTQTCALPAPLSPPYASSPLVLPLTTSLSRRISSHCFLQLSPPSVRRQRETSGPAHPP